MEGISSRFYYSRDLLKMSLNDVLKSSQRITQSSPALLQHGKEVPQDLNMFDITEKGDFEAFKVYSNYHNIKELFH